MRSHGKIPAGVLDRFTQAAMRRDGEAFAALFSQGAAYHDCFYGVFTGRKEIASLIDDWFYRDAHDFRWTFHDPVDDGRTLYARFAFSYRSRLDGAPSGRVGFEGVSIMRFEAGEIREYREVANTGPLLASLNFEPSRIVRFLSKKNRQVWDSDEFAAHRVSGAAETS